MSRKVHKIEDDTEVGEIRQLIGSVPTLSDYIDISCSATEGRFLVASNDLEEGEWFLSEDALVTWPDKRDVLGSLEAKPKSAELASCHDNKQELLVTYEEIFPHLPWAKWANLQSDDTKVGALALASCLCQIAEQLGACCSELSSKATSSSAAPKKESDKANYEKTGEVSEKGSDHEINVEKKHQGEELRKRALASALRPYERLCTVPENTKIAFADGVTPEMIYDAIQEAAHMEPLSRLVDHGILLKQVQGPQSQSSSPRSGTETGDSASSDVPRGETAAGPDAETSCRSATGLALLTNLAERLSQNAIGLPLPADAEGGHGPARKGLFVFLSFCNHDCEPNVMVERDVANLPCEPHCINLKTLRRVKKGEKLCINYCPLSLEYTERRDRLRHWFFECGCGRCAAEGMLLGEMKREKSAAGDVDGEKEGKRSSTVDVGATISDAKKRKLGA